MQIEMNNHVLSFILIMFLSLCPLRFLFFSMLSGIYLLMLYVDIAIFLIMKVESGSKYEKGGFRVKI